MLEEKASAKVNLCLQIVGQKSNGFHLLDSIVGFTEFGDHLSFQKSDELELTTKGAFSDHIPVDKSNLILAISMYGFGQFLSNSIAFLK